MRSQSVTLRDTDSDVYDLQLPESSELLTQASIDRFGLRDTSDMPVNTIAIKQVLIDSR